MCTRNEHVLRRLNDRVALLESQCGAVEKVIRVVEINVKAPVQLLTEGLVSVAAAIASNPDSFVGDNDALSLCGSGLTPLEVEDIVGHVVPVLSEILRVVELLVDTARFVNELSAGSPGGSERPVALRWVIVEFKNAFAGVQCLDVGTAVLRDPVDTIGAFGKLHTFANGQYKRYVSIEA